MSSIALDPYYYQSRLRELQGQKELTTGRGLTQPETESILNAELSQRYNAELSRRQIANQEKIQEKQIKMQEDAAKSANQAAMVSGVGQLALGGASTYGLGVQQGWWGGTAATTTTPAITTTATGVGAGTGVTAAGEGAGIASIGEGTSASMGAGAGTGAGEGGAAAGGGMGAASIVGLILASAAFAAGHTELARKDDTWYGSTVAAGSPWKDQKMGQWGGQLNVATAPFFPEMLTWGMIMKTGTGKKVIEEINRVGDKWGLPGFGQ